MLWKQITISDMRGKMLNLDCSCASFINVCKLSRARIVLGDQKDLGEPAHTGGHRSRQKFPTSGNDLQMYSTWKCSNTQETLQLVTK